MRYLTAGESHGKGLVIIIDGPPSGLKITEEEITAYVAERQKGYGRGGRQKIERDRAEIISGVRFGKTIGSPVAVVIKNRDYVNWEGMMSVCPVRGNVIELNVPRPGHADLPGGIKYGHRDFRNVLERASARETAARVVAGAIAKKILSEMGIDILGYSAAIGGIKAKDHEGLSIDAVRKRIKDTDAKYGADLRYPDLKTAGVVKNRIDEALKEGDTLGGIVRVITTKIAPGIGDYTQWDRKLDAKIAAALMSIQAVKGVEFGAGFSCAALKGSAVHDRIYYSQKERHHRLTNNAGGFEGGMTNGEPVSVMAAVKPISTVKKGMDSVDVNTRKKTRTVYERSDVCAVPAASIIAEAVVAFELAREICASVGGSEMGRIKANYRNYLKQAKSY